MNTKLAQTIASVLRDAGNSLPEGSHMELDSGDVYKELIAKGVEVPEGDMAEILDQFKKAGIIAGPGYMNSDAHKQDGAMVITYVDRQLLKNLDFD